MRARLIKFEACAEACAEEDLTKLNDIVSAPTTQPSMPLDPAFTSCLSTALADHNASVWQQLERFSEDLIAKPEPAPYDLTIIRAQIFALLQAGGAGSRH